MSDRRVVWVLGAGFSRALGGQLLSGLLTRAATHRSLNVYEAAFAEDASLCLGVSLLYEAGASDMRHVKPFESQWDHAEEFLERLALAEGSHHEATNLLAFARRVQRTTNWREERDSDVLQEGLNALNTILDRPDAAELLHSCALRMLAAECCSFLEGVEPPRTERGEKPHIAYERWDPYVRWASSLTGSEAVVTFNYDRVPDLLQRYSNHVDVALPPAGTRTGALPEMEEDICPILKMHGSVDWVWKQVTRSVERTGATAAMKCSHAQRVLATPGPMKKEMVLGHAGMKAGILRPIWDAASLRIRDADVLVFLGYRMPPTDSFSRRWFVDALRANRRAAAERRTSGGVPELRILTVLGDDTNHPHSRRLKGLLERVAGQSIRVIPEPMFAEDFLAVFDRNEL